MYTFLLSTSVQQVKGRGKPIKNADLLLKVSYDQQRLAFSWFSTEERLGSKNVSSAEMNVYLLGHTEHLCRE